MASDGTPHTLAAPEERRRLLEARFPRWESKTLPQSIDALTEEFAQRPFVMTDERTYTYAEMRDWSRRLAAGLIAAGVAVGDHVAMIMANYPEFTAVKYAIARAGATAIPINYLFRRAELGYVLEQSNSRVLITMNRLRDLHYVDELDAIIPGWEQDAGGDELPDLAHVFVFSTDGEQRPGTRTLDNLAALATDADRKELERREAAGDPQSPSDILYTSGTTGRPKGVVLKHDMVLRTAYGSAYHCAFEDGRRMLFSLPMYHVFGYVEALVAATFVGGAIIPQVQFDPVATLEGIERHRANEIAAVPLMTLKVLEVAEQRTFDLSSLTVVFSSGGAAPPTIWGRIRRILGAQEVLTGYGMTETTASTTCTLPEDPEERLLTTNGRLKPAGVAGDPELGGLLALYKVVDPETREDLGPGQRGEFLARGPIITPGYYRKPDETAVAFTEEGWLRTGDIGVLDEEGYLTLTGRIKESYRCGGEMVMPREVELVINEHPLVAETHVVGLPHERMGEVGCACIVAAGDEAPDPQEIVDLCAKQLARFKVPRHVLLVTATELPLTATGRVQKFRLAEIAKDRLAESSAPQPIAT
jgi:fatty-acyl-CoA synthase